MKLFKLKREARDFFKGDLSHRAFPLERWDALINSINLLDEVDKVYIEYGIQEGNTTHLRSWSSNDGFPNGEFYFTVKVNDLNHEQYKDVNIPEVMDEIQKVLNNYFKNSAV